MTEPTQPLDAEPGDADRAVFRRLMGRYATGVAVISTFARQGPVRMDHAMTANSFTSVSLDPMLVSFCVELDTRFDDAVRETGVWGVSILRDGARSRADWFATGGRPLEGEFAGVPVSRGLTGVALLEESLAWLECRTQAIHPGGDHAIVVGEVVAMGGAGDLGDPLLFWAGGYRTVR